MKLSVREVHYGNTASAMVECLIYQYSAIEYAGIIDRTFNKVSDEIETLLSIKANASSKSSDELEGKGYQKYSDLEFTTLISRHFKMDKRTDVDYLSIVNLKYPGEYDRCLIIKSDVVFKNLIQEGAGRDFSYWPIYYKRSYRVVVRKGKCINTESEYSLQEILKMVKDGDIFIINCISKEVPYGRDCSNSIDILDSPSDLKEINDANNWLTNVKKQKNPFHAQYMELFKMCVTEELIDEYIERLVSECRRMLLQPSDKELRMALFSYREEKAFKGMKADERLRYLKQYAKSHDLVNKAKEIIANYSESYKFVMQYSV